MQILNIAPVDCSLCDLCTKRVKVIQPEDLKSSDNKITNVLVIVERPTVSDAKRDMFLSRKIEADFRKKLTHLRGKVVITSLVKCAIDTKPNLNQIEACNPFLLSEIQNLNPKYIIAVGSVVYKYFINDGNFKYATGKIHDVFIQFHNKTSQKFNVIPLMHPAALIDYRQYHMKTKQNQIKNSQTYLVNKAPSQSLPKGKLPFRKDLMSKWNRDWNQIERIMGKKRIKQAKLIF